MFPRILSIFTLLASVLSLSVANVMKNASVQVIPSNSSGVTFFGRSISIEADLLVVGAQGHESTKGIAYIFARTSDDTWKEQGMLQPSETEVGEYFGFGTAIISPTTVAISAPRYNDSYGAVYLYERREKALSDWQSTSMILPTEAQKNLYFGSSIATSTNVMVIATKHPEQPRVVYVFEHEKGNVSRWSQVQVLASNSTKDEYGYEVAVDGNVIVVPAPHAGVGNVVKAGVVHVYERLPSTAQFVHVAKLEPPEPHMYGEFGRNIAIEGRTIAAGMYQHNAVYIFEKKQGNWKYTAKLETNESVVNDHFGISVALSNYQVIVGASGVDNPAAGQSTGAVYTFGRNFTTGSWEQITKITAFDASPGDKLGAKVAVDNTTIVMSAFWKDSATQINTGAVYLHHQSNPFPSLPSTPAPSPSSDPTPEPSPSSKPSPAPTQAASTSTRLTIPVFTLIFVALAINSW